MSAGAVNGVAVINQIRSFDLRARDRDGRGVTYEGMADSAVVDDIAARVASLVDPEPPAPQPKGRGKSKEKSRASAPDEASLGAALKKALTSDK